MIQKHYRGFQGRKLYLLLLMQQFDNVSRTLLKLYKSLFLTQTERDRLEKINHQVEEGELLVEK